MSSSKLIEIDVEVVAKTAKAWLCSDSKTEAWIPVSQIDDYCEENGVVSSIFITEWLATQKGFV